MALIGGGLLLLAGGGAAAFFMTRGGGATDPAPPPTSVGRVLTPPTTLGAAVQPTPELPPPPDPALDPGVQDPLVPAATPTPAPVATPEPVAAATPTPTPEPTRFTATPTPAAPTPTPAPAGPSPAQQRAAQVAALLQQAQQASGAGRTDEAGRLYDQVLQLEPGNAQAQAGKAAIAAVAAALQKTFVPGRTAYASPSKGGGPAGFDTATVADPDYLGELQYEVTPARVKPGDSYTVRVFLVNQGKRDIRPSQLSTTTTVNRQRQPGGGTLRTTEISPGQRGLVHEQSGSWDAATTAWTLDVEVTSQRGDTYGSRLTWR